MTVASAATHITSAMSSKKLCVTKSVGSRAPNTMNFCRLSLAHAESRVGYVEVYIKTKNEVLAPRQKIGLLPMSALGQELPRLTQSGVSALPPKAATDVTDPRVRFVPKGDIARIRNPSGGRHTELKDDRGAIYLRDPTGVGGTVGPVLPP